MGKSILASQPGPEGAESVAQYQQSLKEKTKGMKSMAAELNMYHAQVNDYKDEIERLTRDLQDMKRKYFDQKRREQLLKDAQVARNHPLQLNRIVDLVHISMRHAKIYGHVLRSPMGSLACACLTVVFTMIALD